MSGAPPAEVWRLCACQWGAVAGAGLGVGAIGAAAWGVWIPVAAYLLGTAAYVWQLAPDATLADRERLKALALGAGLRGGGVVGALAVAWLPGPDAGGPGDLPTRALLAVLVALACAGAATALSLVGLDAGRTRALATR